ncbi:hypothetical protein [Jatrophihabitans sp.]|uniref:hypothetical protein n=1 Tax=Jatrophihabitans sp. TaxID=1932789 RepID=UPI0030C703B4|nr:hypothetical protein [Jatrophihabitans sp.]
MAIDDEPAVPQPGGLLRSAGVHGQCLELSEARESGRIELEATSADHPEDLDYVLSGTVETQTDFWIDPLPHSRIHLRELLLRVNTTGFRIQLDAAIPLPATYPLLSARCRLSLIGQYEWDEGFDTPDVRTDWRVHDVVRLRGGLDPDYMLLIQSVSC